MLQGKRRNFENIFTDRRDAGLHGQDTRTHGHSGVLGMSVAMAGMLGYFTSRSLARSFIMIGRNRVNRVNRLYPIRPIAFDSLGIHSIRPTITTTPLCPSVSRV